MVTSFLFFFFPFGYLCFLMFLQWTCVAPVTTELNKKSYKRKGRLLFWQERAYLENHDVKVHRRGSSCDWAGIVRQCPGLREVSSMAAAGLWGIPSNAVGGLKIW